MAQNRTYQVDVDPTNHIRDSMGRPAHEPLGILCLQISPADPRASPVLITLYPYTSAPWLTSCTRSRWWQEQAVADSW